MLKRRTGQLPDHRLSVELGPDAVRLTVNDEQVVFEQSLREVEGEVSVSDAPGVHDARTCERSPRRGKRHPAHVAIDDFKQRKIAHRVGDRLVADEDSQHQLVVSEAGL